MSIVWDTYAKWPDLTKDRKAAEQARAELGPYAGIHQLLSRAQEIKEKL